MAYVLDSDPSKAGRFLAIVHLEVAAPARLKEDPVDAAMIAALTETVVSLRGVYGLEGSIMHLQGRRHRPERKTSPRRGRRSLPRG